MPPPSFTRTQCPRGTQLIRLTGPRPMGMCVSERIPGSPVPSPIYVPVALALPGVPSASSACALLLPTEYVCAAHVQTCHGQQLWGSCDCAQTTAHTANYGPGHIKCRAEDHRTGACMLECAAMPCCNTCGEQNPLCLRMLRDSIHSTTPQVAAII